MAITIEGNILQGVPSDIPLPDPGMVRLFLNADADGRLYYKNELGGVVEVNSEEDCCCMIAQQVMSGIMCALQKGNITMTEFNAFVAAGMTITGESTDDGEGNKTCSLTIGPPPAP